MLLALCRNVLEQNWNKSRTIPEQNLNKRVPVLFSLAAVTLPFPICFWEKAPKNVPDHSPPTMLVKRGIVVRNYILEMGESRYYDDQCSCSRR